LALDTVEKYARDRLFMPRDPSPLDGIDRASKGWRKDFVSFTAAWLKSPTTAKCGGCPRNRRLQIFKT
jgi:hypothetical protein